MGTHLKCVVEADKHLTGLIGRSRSNLFTLIKNDLHQRNLKINSISELNIVRDVARCRERWKNLFKLQFTFIRYLK